MSKQKDRPDRERRLYTILSRVVSQKSYTSEDFDQIIALFLDRFEVEDEFVRAFAKDYKKTHEALHKAAIEEAQHEGGRAVMAILKKEYPAIDTWQCWKNLEGANK